MHQGDSGIDAAQLAEACRDVDGLLAAGVGVGAELLGQAPRLRAISNLGVGYDRIDVAACTQRRILVTNTPGAVTGATADLTFALLMAVARRVPEADRYIREGNWHAVSWELMWGTDLEGKTLGILGFGRIGQAVARRASGFSMRILYEDVERRPPELERELGVQLVDRQTLLRESDFLSLHVPFAPETLHLIGAAEFALMKSTAFLINASRGKVVDEAALVEALQSKRIAGAGLDVFEFEPKVHPALLAMPNVVLTPHIGTATRETRLAMAMMAADNLLAALTGKNPVNVVNPEVWE